MEKLKKRFAMFLLGCIPVRIVLVLLAKYLPNKYLKYLGILSLLPAFGFLILYLFDLRKTGREVLGNKIWWNELRLVHGLLYLMFSIYAIKSKSHAYVPLLIDVILGLVAFMIYHKII